MRCDVRSDLRIARFLDEEFDFVRQSGEQGVKKVRVMAESMKWEDVDVALRSIAKRRAALDVEEARWLRAAEQVELWRELGMVSMLDYMERALGYGPHNAKERLRVAHALEELP